MSHRSLPVRCSGLLHMQKNTFIRLFDELRVKNYLHNSRYQHLWTSCNISTYNRAQIFRFSYTICLPTFGRNVRLHFQGILHALFTFAKEMVKHPSVDETLLKILKNVSYYPWFKECVGFKVETHLWCCSNIEGCLVYVWTRQRVHTNCQGFLFFWYMLNLYIV